MRYQDLIHNGHRLYLLSSYIPASPPFLCECMIILIWLTRLAVYSNVSSAIVVALTVYDRGVPIGTSHSVITFTLMH
jgi:hypothetical protein